MADRYPLIYNPTANQIQELQSGDSLDVGNSSIKGATGYATTTGTSSQFLKADGSIDSNTYLTSAGTVALAQGLTGSPSITVSAVSGTSGTFSGDVSAVNVSASSSVTATTFYGDGSSLTGIDASALKDGSDVKVQATATGATITGDISATNATFSGNLTVQGTTSTIDTIVTSVDSLTVDGSVGIGTTNPQRKLVVSDNGTEGLEFYPGDSVNGSTINAYNRETSGFTPFSLNALDYRFSPNGGSEALRITSSGNVGINSTIPAYAVDVVVGNDGGVRIHGTGNNNALTFTGDNSNAGFRIDYNNINDRILIDRTDRRGAVTPASTLVTFDSAGNIEFTGIATAIQFDATSDIALKENIEIIDNPIDKLSELKGVTFDWKFGGHSVGVIAQDVEKVLPTAVGGSNDQKTVNYNAIIGLLVESVKDQQKQIEELKSLLDK